MRSCLVLSVSLAVGLVSFAVSAAPRILPRTLVVTQTQFYPLREFCRGYLGRWIDQPLCLDPDLPTARSPGDQLFTHAELEQTERDVLSYGLDGVAYFNWRRACLDQADGSSVTNCLHVPIACFWPSGTERDFAMIDKALKGNRLYRHNGKVLLLSYWTAKNSEPERLAKVLADLRKKYGDIFYFIPDMEFLAYGGHVDSFDKTGDMTAEQIAKAKARLRAYLNVADGIYFGETHMLGKPDLTGEHAFRTDFYRRIVSLMRETLDEPAFRGRKMLALSAITGYEDTSTKCRIASANGTRTLRESLKVALDAEPDVIMLPEWDEYNENTCFAPTLYNGSAVRRIMRQMLAEARKERLSPIKGDDLSRPNLIVSHRKSLAPGEQFYVELLNVPDGGLKSDVTCRVTIYNENGRSLEQSDPLVLLGDRLDEKRFTMPTADIGRKARALRVRVDWSCADGRSGSVADGLCAVDFATPNAWNPRVVRQPLRDLAPVTVKTLKMDGSKLTANLACTEPIRYAFVSVNGDIRHVEGNAASQSLDFEATADRAVYEITAVAWKSTYTSDASRFHLDVKGVPEAEWLQRTDAKGVRGESFGPDRIAETSAPVYLAMPRDRIASAQLDVGYGSIVTGRVSLAEVERRGVFVLGAPQGAQVSVLRLDRSALYPSVLNRPACAFSYEIRPDWASSVAWVEAVTMSGKTWRSRPFVLERDVVARSPRLKYDFAPGTGEALVTQPDERRFRGMLGGSCSQAMGYNRNWSVFGGFRYGYEAQYVNRLHATDGRPVRVREPDGGWSLAFDGKDDYASFPWETVPVWGDFTISLDVFPTRQADDVSLMTTRDASGCTAGNLWEVTLKKGKLVVEYLSQDAGWTSLATNEDVPTNRWSKISIARRGGQMEVTVNGVVRKGRCGKIGLHSNVFLLGLLPYSDPFEGRMRNLVISHELHQGHRNIGWRETGKDVYREIYCGVDEKGKRKKDWLVCDTVVRRIPDGRLAYFMLFGGQTEPSPENRTAVQFSSDDGKTWTPPETVDLGLPRSGTTIGQGPTEFRVLPDGKTTLLFFATHSTNWNFNWKSWTIRSTDNCRTWSKPEPLPGRLAEATFIRASIQTSDGRLLAPFQHCRDMRRVSSTRNGVLESTDGGRTWQEFGDIILPIMGWRHVWAEPAIVELEKNHIAMFIRPEWNGCACLYRVDSHDGGHSWPTVAEKTDIPNPSSKVALFKLPGNRVALVHNPNPKRRSPLALWISEDGMKTWSYKRILCEMCMDGIAYPEGFVSEDGKTLYLAFDVHRHIAAFMKVALPEKVK